MTPTQLWQRYLKTHPQAADALVSSYHFGDAKEEANAAVTRICLGEKTGCISFPQAFEAQGAPCPPARGLRCDYRLCRKRHLHHSGFVGGGTVH